MSQLFDLPANTRIRITSTTVLWLERGTKRKVDENVTWEGTTTDVYYTHQGVRRRLIVNHTLDQWRDHGIWQRDKECEVLGQQPETH